MGLREVKQRVAILRPMRLAQRYSAALAGLISSLLPAAAAAVAPPPPPWEFWRDLTQLARLVPGDQVLLRSSHCPSGCRFDRTSDGDPRFLRVEGEEAVIFDEPGAGAIVRIWMTMGQGVSEPLDPSIRLRIRLDGEAAPRVDLPLPDLFRGDVPPFLAPLVADRDAAGGGNVSYVPIPYRRGCRISLVGAQKARLWYQIHFHRLARPGAVASFRVTEDLSALRELLLDPGSDPWPAAPPERSTAGAISLAPGEERALLVRHEADLLQTLRLKVPRSAWSRLWIRLEFDGERRAHLPLRDFFAIPKDGALGAQSLLIGEGPDGELYSYFPMPFFESARVTLQDRGAAGAPPVDVGFTLAWQGQPPAPDSGLFGVQAHRDDETAIGQDAPLFALTGQGKWVGIFAELGSVASAARTYLEGDERVYLDGSAHPALYGTGVEDLFNGGFYFDQGEKLFRSALAGAVSFRDKPNGEHATAMYRMMLADAVPFRSSIRAGLEGGTLGDLAMRARVVSYFYSLPEPALERVDRLVPGNAASSAAHAYRKPSTASCGPLRATFEGQPALTRRVRGCALVDGVSRFVLRRPGTAGPARLRRLLDAGTPGQEAEVYANGVRVGVFPYVDANPFHRWREIDLDLAAPPIAGAAQIEFEIRPRGASAAAPYTEYGYELWAAPLLQ
jgi:hypothetical protein